MIVLREKRTLVFTAPKTASSSLHAYFGASTEDQHGMAVPAGCEGYRILVTARDPRTRAYSLFGHFIQGHPRHPRACSYKVFWEWLCEPVEEPFYQWTLSAWYHGLPRIDGVLRLESLDADVRRLGLADGDQPLPRLNAQRFPEFWREPYLGCPECSGLVRQWAAEDFEAFGYGA